MQEHCVIQTRWHGDADSSFALPNYESKGAAGCDLRANFGPLGGEHELSKGQRMLIPTGLCLELPQGFEAQIRPRSGLALKHGLTVLNSPGTIDSDYRGPIGVILVNLGQDVYKVNHGDRIAQMVIAPVVQAQFTPASTLSHTSRGDLGFGSTGKC